MALSQPNGGGWIAHLAHDHLYFGLFGAITSGRRLLCGLPFLLAGFLPFRLLFLRLFRLLAFSLLLLLFLFLALLDLLRGLLAFLGLLGRLVGVRGCLFWEARALRLEEFIQGALESVCVAPGARRREVERHAVV